MTPKTLVSGPVPGPPGDSSSRPAGVLTSPMTTYRIETKTGSYDVEADSMISDDKGGVKLYKQGAAGALEEVASFTDVRGAYDPASVKKQEPFIG